MNAPYTVVLWRKRCEVVWRAAFHPNEDAARRDFDLLTKEFPVVRLMTAAMVANWEPNEEGLPME